MNRSTSGGKSIAMTMVHIDATVKLLVSCLGGWCCQVLQAHHENEKKAGLKQLCSKSVMHMHCDISHKQGSES
eukprot:1589883-Amphidinium_carterae.2